MIMLREILAITGKPGLFKVLSHSGKTLIVEDIQNGKRFPVSMRDKVVSLGDIAMYTMEEDRPLGEILEKIYEDEKGEKIDVKVLTKDGKLKEQFAVFVPDFDQDRVRDSDIKKLFSWYNILIEAGFTKFVEEKAEEKASDSEEEKEEESKDANKEAPAEDKENKA